MAKLKEAEQIKQVFKDALTETLKEQRDFLREIFVEAIEDIALVEAIREGQKTPPATRAEVFRLLKGGA